MRMIRWLSRNRQPVVIIVISSRLPLLRSSSSLRLILNDLFQKDRKIVIQKILLIFKASVHVFALFELVLYDFYSETVLNL